MSTLPFVELINGLIAPPHKLELNLLSRYILLLVSFCISLTGAAEPALRVSANGVHPRSEALSPMSERVGDFDALYLESVCQRLKGNRDAAYELLNECLKVRPDAQEALYDMAKLKLSAGALMNKTWVAEGDSLLRRAYAVDTTNIDVCELLAQHLLSRNEYAEATRLFERLCNVKSPEYTNLGMLIRLYEIEGKYEKALEAVGRMETLEGADAMTAWERYQIYQCTGERARALQTYDSLLVKAMPDPSTPDYIRQELTRQPMYYEKVKALRDSLVATFETRDSLTIRALCREGQLFEPDFLPYYYFEALSSYRIDGANEALDACRRGLNQIKTTETPKEYSPEYRSIVDLYTLTGDLYTEVGNLEAAVEMYEEVVKRDSTVTMVLNNYAYQLSLLGRDLQKAERMSRQTLQEAPDNPTYLDTYAWVLHRLGRNREARKYINKAIKMAESPDETVLEHREAIYKK